MSRPLSGEGIRPRLSATVRGKTQQSAKLTNVSVLAPLASNRKELLCKRPILSIFKIITCLRLDVKLRTIALIDADSVSTGICKRVLTLISLIGVYGIMENTKAVERPTRWSVHCYR
ncbi:hypothetical protein CWRG_02533 [Chthonomonas calidirosea]|nr:hypothetical protein CWRG_02533 [Chthonomonas calidirosea]